MIPIADCGSCGEPIFGSAWWHHRLHVHLHDDRAACLDNVVGEDVTSYAMSLVGMRLRPAEGQGSDG